MKSVVDSNAKTAESERALHGKEQLICESSPSPYSNDSFVLNELHVLIGAIRFALSKFSNRITCKEASWEWEDVELLLCFSLFI